MNINSAFESWVAFGATWVLWLLVGLSVLALAVILERLIFFGRTCTDAARLRGELEQSAEQDDLVGFRTRLSNSPSLEARIVGAGANARSPVEAEERMAAEAQIQRLRSEQNLAILGTLGNNAPFVGLLGTVLGIIGAFQELDASRGKLTTGLMTEIGEALIATAVGLVVALPAVAAYNFFQRMIQVRVSRADALGRELIAHLHVRANRQRSVHGVTAAPQGGE